MSQVHEYSTAYECPCLLVGPEHLDQNIKLNGQRPIADEEHSWQPQVSQELVLDGGYGIWVCERGYAVLVICRIITRVVILSYKRHA